MHKTTGMVFAFEAEACDGTADACIIGRTQVRGSAEK
jgi:hypothetical protein